MRVQLALCALLLIQREAPTPVPANLPTVLTVLASEAGSQTPVDGVTISILPAELSLVVPRAVALPTTNGGRLVMTGLAPGRYRIVATPPETFATVSVWLPMAQSQIQIVELKAGERPTLQFVFKRPASVSGVVESPTGKPVSGVPVDVVAWSSTVHGRPVVAPVRTATSDVNGRFTLDKLRPGQYLLRARPPAVAGVPMNDIYAPGTSASRDATPLFLDAGDDLTMGLTVRAVPSVDVGGRVVNPRGDPAGSVRLTLVPLDRATSLAVVRASSAVNPSVISNQDGRFIFHGVLSGLYALRAVDRRDENTPPAAAGALELEVGTAPIDDANVQLVVPARITGRFLFNGIEEPDPARTQLAVIPDGDHGHLRDGLAITDTWHADGSFEVEGLYGTERLTLRSSGAWYIERVALQDGTDLTTAGFAFEPGRTYANARVWLSDRVATISGTMQSRQDDESLTIVAFPEDPALRGPGTRHVREGRLSVSDHRFTIAGLPAGQTYLVAAVRTATVMDPGASDLFDRLAAVAVHVLVETPGRYEVVLGPPLER